MDIITFHELHYEILVSRRICADFESTGGNMSIKLGDINYLAVVVEAPGYHGRRRALVQSPAVCQRVDGGERVHEGAVAAHGDASIVIPITNFGVWVRYCNRPYTGV